MKNNNKQSKKYVPSREKSISCGCGGRAKLGSKKNYPFGKKSKTVLSIFYKCEKCGNVKVASNNSKGGRR